MKVSCLFDPTLREAPAEAEIKSHQLLLRAGFIRREAAGIYSYLPLGLRVIRKIERIVREEMDAVGGQEVMMPLVQPAELWQKTGRWDLYGPEMFRLRDRHGRDFCLGPTHEEVVTELVRGEVRSYRQLPLYLYQIQNKYRDERRPRFGLMRGREFIMMDMYSFDRSAEDAVKTYRLLYEAYERVFDRAGIGYRAVEADAGAIGGTGGTHEFMVLADAGEAEIVYCESCDYAANIEKAEVGDGLARPATAQPASKQPASKQPASTQPASTHPAPTHPAPASTPAYTTVATPGAHTIAEVTEFLQIPPSRLLKTLVYKGDERWLVAVCRGDRQINEVKLANAYGPFVNLRLATADEVNALLVTVPGFVGPVRLPAAVELIIDIEAAQPGDYAAGANEDDTHLLHVLPGRDFSLDKVCDLRLVEAGEPCPHCGAPLHTARGIEVGQVFNLGTKYSEALGAGFVDENGAEQPFHMGCYGIGVGRTMAAAIEQLGDENGLVWPLAIAPYQVVVIPANMKDETVAQTALELYEKLLAAGVEAVFDDRDERPGVKFKDADLVGYPLRLVISAKTLAEGKAELKGRTDKTPEFIPLPATVDTILKLLVITSHCEESGS